MLSVEGCRTLPSDSPHTSPSLPILPASPHAHSFLPACACSCLGLCVCALRRGTAGGVGALLCCPTWFHVVPRAPCHEAHVGRLPPLPPTRIQQSKHDTCEKFNGPMYGSMLASESMQQMQGRLQTSTKAHIHQASTHTCTTPQRPFIHNAPDRHASARASRHMHTYKCATPFKRTHAPPRPCTSTCFYADRKGEISVCVRREAVGGKKPCVRLLGARCGFERRESRWLRCNLLHRVVLAVSPAAATWLDL